jgi:ketosteroid isomerase-like protein
VGWKQAFLEFFSESAVGFDGESIGNAKDQVRQNPDPPPEHQLLWEPRYGDVSGSGELGYLTGPSRNILPSRNKGQPRHGVYASIWKRDRDGSFRVVMDVGIPTRQAAPFAAGFTRAPHANRFRGDYDERTPPLSAADGVLNADLKTSAARAYRGRLAPGARFHRPGAMPVVGEAAVTRWLTTQPPFSLVDSRFAESAQSGDLGYTWGMWARPAPRGRNTGRGRAGSAGAPPLQEEGLYVRVWARERTGQWKVVLDVLN